jgi:hypothetical protein
VPGMCPARPWCRLRQSVHGPIDSRYRRRHQHARAAPRFVPIGSSSESSAEPRLADVGTTMITGRDGSMVTIHRAVGLSACQRSIQELQLGPNTMTK